MVRLFLFWLVLASLFSVENSRAAFSEVKRTNQDVLPNGPDFSVRAPKSLSALAKIRWAEKNKKWEDCLTHSRVQLGTSPIQKWIHLNHLRCLKAFYGKNLGRKIQYYLEEFSRTEASHQEILASPVEDHRKQLLIPFFELAELALRRDRSLLKGFLNRHAFIVESLSKNERGRYYALLGGWAQENGQEELALQNYIRSYNFQPSSKVWAQLKKRRRQSWVDEPPLEGEETYSPEENEIWKRFRRAAKKGRYQKMALEGAKFLQKFPGSQRVEQVSEDLLRALRKVIRKRKAKYKPMKTDFLRHLGEAPGWALTRWIPSSYGRGYYKATLELARLASRKLASTPQAAEALLIAGKSAYFLAEWSEAQKFFETLQTQYVGHKATAEARYYLGLLHFRQNRHSQVVGHFERFLKSKGSDLWELQTRYWLWRALKKTGSSRAKVQEKIILEKFPLTYYGLRIRSETTSSLQSLFVEKPVGKISVSYWWSDANQSRWKRILLLIQNGWREEAETEIDFLPSPTTADGHYVRAHLWKAAQKPVRMVMELSAAVDKDPKKYLAKEVLQMAFPQTYLADVRKVAADFTLDPNLILAIIRQESSFSVNAVSPSNAAGLMQLVPVTARETAKWLKYKKFRWPDTLFNPSTNIRFGSHYLKRMMGKYKRVVPLALASYNVGPGNLDRWLRQRADLADWEQFGGELVDDMWMDELPWAETAFYAKAILRNYLLYKIIYHGEDKLTEPPWNDAKSIVPPGKAS